MIECLLLTGEILKIKEFDIENMQITSDIETGDNTSPISLINRYYRTIVMNGGSNSNKDSTIIVIDHKDNLVPLANMMGSLYIGITLTLLFLQMI